MKRLLLHIGMPKTGTTSIQEAFAKVATADFRYAHLDFWENHSEALGTIFKDDPNEAFLHDLLGRSTRKVLRKKRVFRKRFDRELARPEQTVMMSGELVSRFSQGEVRRLCKAVEKSGRELHVVVFLRDPASHTSSLFQEVMKLFHAQPRRVPLRSYRRTLLRWMKCVKNNQLHVQRYDPASFPNGSAVAHFAKVFDLPIPPDFPSKNSGLSDPVVRLLWIFSGLDLPQPNSELEVMRRLFFIDALNDGMSGPKFTLPPAALQVTGRIERQVEWLNTAFNIDFSPQLDAIRGEVNKDALRTTLSDISPEVEADLDRVLASHRITLPEGASLKDKLVALHDSFGRVQLLLAGWRLLVDDGGARLRRSVKERLRHPFG